MARGDSLAICPDETKRSASGCYSVISARCRGDFPVSQIVILSSVVARNHDRGSRHRKTNIIFHYDCSSEYLTIQDDMEMIEQVLINLLKNAKEALTETEPDRPPDIPTDDQGTF